MKLDVDSINEKMLCNRQYVGILSADERRQFGRRACEGANLDPTEALRQLINEYMENCGISAGIRTLYYDAADGILQEFLVSNHPVAEELNEQEIYCLAQCMERFNPDYSAEEYGDYDVALMKAEEYLRLCVEQCSYNIPASTKAALCYGLYLQFYEHH